MFIKVIYGKYAFFFFFFHNGAPSTKFVNYIAVLSFCQYNGLGGENTPFPYGLFKSEQGFLSPYNPLSFTSKLRWLYSRCQRACRPLETPTFFKFYYLMQTFRTIIMKGEFFYKNSSPNPNINLPSYRLFLIFYVL